MSDRIKTWQFHAISDIHTGDIGQKSQKLKNTGILGSIRWWYEVLVRGLGGYACDPTYDKQEYRCPNKKKNPGKEGHHCVACELFGYTDWARKFRFEVRDESNEVKTTQIKQDNIFYLNIIPLRYIRDEEWTLLDATLKLIAEYGTIGGRTTFKPSDEEKRKKVYHLDFGLIKLDQRAQFNRV